MLQIFKIFTFVGYFVFESMLLTFWFVKTGSDVSPALTNCVFAIVWIVCVEPLIGCR